MEVTPNKRLRKLMEGCDRANEEYKTISNEARHVLNLWANLDEEDRKAAMAHFAKAKREKAKERKLPA